MRKSVKVDETVDQMSSDQLSQRLLASAVRDKSPLLEIFSDQFLGVAPSLFDDNGEIRKNKKAEPIKNLLTSCGTNINQISVLFDWYRAESTKGTEEK